MSKLIKIIALIMAICYVTSCSDPVNPYVTGNHNLILSITGTKGVSQTIYAVDRLLIEISGPQDRIIEWTYGDDTQYLLTLPAGSYQLKITHYGVNGSGEVIEAVEYMPFNIEAGTITAINIIPGCTGVIVIDDGINGWPMARHDKAHRAVSNYRGPDSYNVAWTCTIGGNVKSSPAVGNDTIYVGNEDGILYALTADGSIKWSFEGATAGITSSPAISPDGTIYFGSHDLNIYALNPDGTEKWNYTTGGAVYSSPVIDDDGTIYIGSSDAILYGLNPDGTLKGSFTAEGSIVVAPVIGSDGTIYFGSCNNNRFYAVKNDFTLKWSSETFSNVIGSSPALSNDETVVIFGCDDGYLYAYDSNSGIQQWKRWSYGGVQSSPAVGRDDRVYVGTQYGNLWCLNIVDGTLVWDIYTTLSVFSSPVIDADGVVYFFTAYGMVYAVNPDGTIKWNDGPSGGIHFFGSPALASNGHLYIGANDGLLYAMQ